MCATISGMLLPFLIKNMKSMFVFIIRFNFRFLCFNISTNSVMHWRNENSWFSSFLISAFSLSSEFSDNYWITFVFEIYSSCEILSTSLISLMTSSNHRTTVSRLLSLHHPSVLPLMAPTFRCPTAKKYINWNTPSDRQRRRENIFLFQ